MGLQSEPAPPRRSTQIGTRPFRFGGEDHSPDPDPPLAPGTMVGDRYRIVSLLGEGGMGRVYAADHTMLERRVALKLLRRDAQAQADTVARFQQEALAASRIGHPNIVEVVDFASLPDGRVYMVMEMLEGESLEDWMDREGRLDEAISILIGVAEGLDAAHQAGVIHRDIKPANIFLSNTGAVKILDFGIAKMTKREVDGFETQAGSVLGTPYYLAPERIMGEPLTPRADLYSVGVIAYELLTGMVPFVADTFMAILARHVKTPPMDPRQAAPERPIPDGIAQLTMRLLEKEPDARPASGAELADMLRELLEREGPRLAAVHTGPRDLPASVEDDTQILDDTGASIAARDTAVSGLGPMKSFAEPAASTDRASTKIGHSLSATEAPGSSPVAVQPAVLAEPPERTSAMRMAAPILAIAVLGVGAGLAWVWLSEDPGAGAGADSGEVAAPTVDEPAQAPAVATPVAEAEATAGSPEDTADERDGADPASGETSGEDDGPDATKPAADEVASGGESATKSTKTRKKPRKGGKPKRETGAGAEKDSGKPKPASDPPPEKPKTPPADDGPNIKDDVYDD